MYLKIKSKLQSLLSVGTKIIIKAQQDNKFYIIIFILSIIIGMIYLSIHLFKADFLAAEGLDYYPVTITNFDEINVTIPRIREILDGHYLVSEIDIYEHIGKPALIPFLPPLLLAPIILFTKSAPYTMVVADFIFTTIYFWIFYFLGYFLFNKKKWFALLFSVFLSLFTTISHYIPYSWTNIKILVANLLPFQYHFWRDRVSLYMMESSIPDFIIFGPGILFLLIALLKNKLKYYVLAGLFFGLMFYTYFFHWSYYLTVLIILVVLFLIKKDFSTAKKLLITIGTGLLISIYYFYQYFLLRVLPHYQEIADRVWIEKSHLFRWSEWQNYFIILILIVIIYLITRKNDQKIGLFLISFLLASVVVLNIQVITGFNIQPSHWMTRTNMFALDFALFYLLYRLLYYLKSNKICYYRVLLGLLISGCISLISGSIHSQYVYAKVTYKDYTLDRNFIDSLNWLNKNIATDAVILTPSFEINIFLPVYTPARIYLPRALNTVASDDEMIERLYISLRIFGIEKDYLKEKIFGCKEDNLMADPGELYCTGSGMYYFFGGKMMGTELDAYKKKKSKKSLSKEDYERMIDNFSIYPEFNQEMLTKYRIDYVYVGLDEKQLLNRDIDSLVYFEKVYSEGGIDIYKFNSDKLNK